MESCHAPEPTELPRAQAVQHPEAPVALGSGCTGHVVENHHLQNRGKRCAGESHAPLPRVPTSPHSEVNLLLCPLRPRTDRVRHALRERLHKKGGGMLDLIFMSICLKAFTPRPPLTAVPRRSNASCDKIEVIPRRC